MTPRAQPLGEPVLLDVAGQLLEQLGDGDEVDVGPVHHLHAQGDRQVGLADPRRPEEDHVLPWARKRRVASSLDLLAVDRRLETDVEVRTSSGEPDVLSEPSWGRETLTAAWACNQSRRPNSRNNLPGCQPAWLRGPGARLISSWSSRRRQFIGKGRSPGDRVRQARVSATHHLG